MLSRALSRGCRRVGNRKRRDLSARRARHAVIRTRGWRLFHRLGAAAPRSSGIPAALWVPSAMNTDRPFVLCLTGSLAMGKSTAAKFFAECGVPVHDSDAVVHSLYEGEAAALIEAAFPGSTSGGKVDRGKLAAIVVNDKAALARLEAIIHPLVTASRERFLAEAQAQGAAVVVVDTPLLLEPEAQPRCEALVLFRAPPAHQRRRALAR